MRILHVLDHSLPLQSGYVYRTLGILTQQRALGWDPVMLTSGKHYAPGPAREQIGDWEFLRTAPPTGVVAKFPGVRDLRIIRDLDVRLDDVIEELKPDILHAHSPALNALPAIRLGKRRGVPVVYEVRAFWEDAHISAKPGIGAGLRYRATRQLETYALRRADAVVTICDGLSADIVARGIPPDKVTIVPNAVDREVFAGPGIPNNNLALWLGLVGKTVLGFFGSFYAYEGLDLLLLALTEIRRSRSDVAVLLAGGGPEEGRLKTLARLLGDGTVVFAGRVPHQEIQRYYDLADLLVFPRRSMRLTELVTPLKPLEAMAQQRIVVASDVGGHRELIRDGETGYLFAPGSPHQLADGVLRALADRESWPRVRRQALDFIQTERSWDRSVARYAEIYHRLLQR